MGVYTDFKYLRQVSASLRNYKELEQFKVQFSCPICGDSTKIPWKARGYVYVYQGKTFFKCQNCGEALSFGMFLKHIDEGAWRDWRKESLSEDPQFTITKPKPQLISVKKESYENMQPILKLPADHDALLYLKARGVPTVRYPLLYFTDNFRALVEEVFPGKGGRFPEDSRLVFPIYNQQKELVAMTGRTISGAKIRYAKATSDDQKCFFGLERMDVSKPVIVVEGPVDSLFLPNSVAVCHAELGMFARTFPSVNSILVFDNEPLNSSIVKFMRKAIDEERCVCVWLDCPFKGKDINEMLQNGAELKTLFRFILNNSFKGERARQKMVSWKKVT